MRILLLTQWFTPEPAIAYQELAEELTSLGHEVTVVTGFPNWPGGKIYPGYRTRLWQKEKMGDISVLRLPVYPDHGRGKLKRILNLSSLSLSFVLLAPWLVRRPDRIHAVQLPTLAIAARFTGFFWRTPYTFEVQDMWPETLESTGMIMSPKLLRLVGRICGGVYRKARAIRVISPGFKRNLIAKGVPETKVEVITNWVDLDAYKPVPRDSSMAKELGLEGKFVVLYAGTMGLAQSLGTVLEAAALLKNAPEILFAFAGYGVEEEALRDQAKQMNLDNVRFLGSFSHDAMNQLYSLANALLIHLRDDPLFSITIPGKTLTYLAVGRPIIAALSGDAAEIVLQAGAGYSCKSEDPAALADTIKRLYDLPQAEREAMGARGREAAVRQYGKKPLTSLLEKMIVGPR